MNKWLISGRLTRDAEAITTQNGNMCLKFTVAQSEKSADKTYTEYVNCVWWAKSADKLHPHLTKGKKILVDGRSRTEKWTDKTGQPRERVVMAVHSAEFDFNKIDNSAPEAQRQAYEQARNIADELGGTLPGDEVPF